jgi:hypothetical protein
VREADPSDDDIAAVSEVEANQREDRKQEKDPSGNEFAAILNMFFQSSTTAKPIPQETMDSADAKSASVITDITSEASSGSDPLAGLTSDSAAKSTFGNATKAADATAVSGAVAAGQSEEQLTVANALTTVDTSAIKTSLTESANAVEPGSAANLPNAMSSQDTLFTQPVSLPENIAAAAQTGHLANNNSQYVATTDAAAVTTTESTLFIAEPLAADLPDERDEVSRQIAAVLAQEDRPTRPVVSAPAQTQPLVTQGSVPLVSSERNSVVTPQLAADTAPAIAMVEEATASPQVAPTTAALTAPLWNQQQNSGEGTNSRQRPKDQQSADIDAVASNSSRGPEAGSSVAGTVRSSAPADFAETVSAELRQPLSSQVSQAVLTHLERIETQDADILTVRLDPPELGELVIELSKSKEGLSVRVTAREAVTMDMLLARGAEIEAQLRGDKMDLNSLEFLSPSSMNDNTSQQRHHTGPDYQPQIQTERRSDRRILSTLQDSRTVNAATETPHALSFRA